MFTALEVSLWGNCFLPGSLFKDSTTPCSDSDTDTDSALARVLATSLNPHLRVAKIQLEVPGVERVSAVVVVLVVVVAVLVVVVGV